MRTFLLLSAIALCFSFVSCQEEDTFYSCDPEVDAWTKENIEEIQSIDTETFRQYDTSHRLAIFNAITPEMRVNIWKEKINETLKLNWSEAESEHIKQLLTIINEKTEWYKSDALMEEQKEYEIMAYRWANYAKENLGWKNELIAAIAASPLLLKNTTGELITPTVKMAVRLKIGKEGTKVEEMPSCTCNPVVSFCSPCSYGICDETFMGCGFLGIGICNGIGC